MASLEGFTPYLGFKEKIWKKLITTTVLIKFKTTFQNIYKNVTSSKVVNMADRLLSVDRLFKKPDAM